MKRFWSLILLAIAGWAEAISGTVTTAQGPLAGANVRVRNTATGVGAETETGADGSFVLTLTEGVYDVFFRKPAHLGVTRRDVAVAKGAVVRFDVTLGLPANNGVPGETAFQIIGEATAPLSGPVPRMAGGKPDLSGVWLPSQDIEPDDPPYLPWAAALQRDRASFSSKDDPRAHCLPSGVVRTNQLELTKFVQAESLLVILIEGSPPGFRQVYLDGRGHPQDPDPSWMGHSAGRWEDDTLVIDTVGFNDRGWLDTTGKPQTEKLHVIERMRRANLGTLEIEITIDDPGAYEHPWKLRRLLKLAPQEELREYVCNENEKPEHLVGK